MILNDILLHCLKEIFAILEINENASVIFEAFYEGEIGTVFFLWARYKALGSMMQPDLTSNILNNPYVHSTRAQQIATVLITWGIYLKLLFFPHPLTHDYYPHQIAITDFSNPLVWLILASCIALVVYGIWNLKKKTVPAFGILYFIITFLPFLMYKPFLALFTF